MRKIVVLLTGLFFALTSFADVVMHMYLPRTRYMLYEPVMAGMVLRNTSGQVLVFGTEAEFQGHLELEFFDMHDRPVKGSGVKIDLRGLILRPGVDHRIRVDLTRWLDLRRVGSFRLRAYISHPMLKHEYASNRCSLDISQGQVFWSRNFGVPDLQAAKLGNDAKIRKYSIRSLQDKNDIHLYLQVEDKEKIYVIKHLGILLGRERPTCELDEINQLHILFPVSQKMFQYTIYDWNGQPQKQSFYRMTKTAPVLSRSSNTGEVKVLGGEVVQPGVEYSPQKLLPNTPVQVNDPLDTMIGKPGKNASSKNTK